MAKENAKSPAFPDDNYYGLSKREYFTAMAMQGLVISGFGTGTPDYRGGLGQRATEIADATLKQLEDEVRTGT